MSAHDDEDLARYRAEASRRTGVGVLGSDGHCQHGLADTWRPGQAELLGLLGAQRIEVAQPGPALQRRPLLVLVSGKPGSGKSTLAQRLAAQDILWLPLLSLDAIKTGVAETLQVAAEDTARWPVLTGTAVAVFYATITQFLRAGVSLIAEHSFRRGLSERGLQPSTQLARIVNVYCQTSPAEAHRRFVERERARRPNRQPIRGAQLPLEHMARGTFDWDAFDPLDLDVPTLLVDTTREYAPDLDTIVAFCRGASHSRR